MQEINVILKSLNEIEFFFAYQKQILILDKCKCGDFMHDFKKYDKIASNMMNSTEIIKKEILKIHSENIRLNRLNSDLTEKLSNLTNPKFERYRSQQNINNMPYNQIHFLKATQKITTIGKEIEETESKLAFLKNVSNKTDLSSSSSFVSSGYGSQPYHEQNLSRKSHDNLVKFNSTSPPVFQTIKILNEYNSNDKEPVDNLKGSNNGSITNSQNSDFIISSSSYSSTSSSSSPFLGTYIPLKLDNFKAGLSAFKPIKNSQKKNEINQNDINEYEYDW